MKRLLRKVLWTLVVLILVVVALAAVTPQGKAAVRTALFIPQVLPTIPVKPQEWFTSDPVWKEVSYPQANGEGVADLILPADAENNSAVLFFLGVVVNRPREDTRVIALAEGLARSGMVVMIPWSDTQLQQRIVPDDIDDLVSAFQFLRSLDEVDPERVGMGGICTGASMSLIAAQTNGFEKMSSSSTSSLATTTHSTSRRPSGAGAGSTATTWRHGDTDKLTYRVFRNHLIEGVSDPEERALLTRVFKDEEPAAESEIAALSTEAMAVHKLLAGAPYADVDGLMEQLSPATKEFLREVSPSTNIDKLKARVLIMHDRADKLVPSEESRRMADALSAVSDTYYTEFSFFQKEIQLHIGDAGTVGPLEFASEAFKLYLHMYNIMRDIS